MNVIATARDYAGLIDTSLPTHKLARQVLLVATVALTAAPASAQSISANPGGSSVIAQAVDWLRGTLLGNVATGLAILAVAILGILAMTGRIEWSRAGLAVLRERVLPPVERLGRERARRGEDCVAVVARRRRHLHVHDVAPVDARREVGLPVVEHGGGRRLAPHLGVAFDDVGPVGLAEYVGERAPDRLLASAVREDLAHRLGCGRPPRDPNAIGHGQARRSAGTPRRRCRSLA